MLQLRGLFEQIEGFCLCFMALVHLKSKPQRAPYGGCYKFLYLLILISLPKKTPPHTVLSAAHPLEVMKLCLPGLTLKESIFTVMFSRFFCSLSVLSSLEMQYHLDDIKPETSGKKAWFSSNPSELLQCLKHPSGQHQLSSDDVGWLRSFCCLWLLPKKHTSHSCHATVLSELA